MLAPISSPVIPVLFHPALLGLSLVISVVWVIFHLLALPTSFPDTLAIFLTVAMILDVRVWKKKTSAGRICTSNLLVHGFSPTGTINL
ncbi:hypothetical protein GTO36_04645, partial [bacterium]|nr:hypothetical protein [bacterium]